MGSPSASADVTRTGQRSRGRPTADEVRVIDDRLRAAALDLFLARGYEAATMEAIAAAAGITKKTLYARHPDKESLFMAVVPVALAKMPFEGVEIDIASDDLERALRDAARQIVASLTEPRAIALRRLTTLEAHRFPDLAVEAHAHLWAQSVRSIVELLAAHTDGGAGVDLEDAASHFMSLVAGPPTVLADLGIRRSDHEADRQIEGAVTLFLNGLLPRGSTNAAPAARARRRRRPTTAHDPRGVQ